MSRSPRIFVSHSAHREDDPVAADFLVALHERLRQDDAFEPLIDQFRLRQELGADWRDTLHMWMELCDGAVILINKRALAPRSWVRHEASLLVDRRRHEKDFPIIPVLLPPMTLAEVKNELEAQNLIALEAAMVDGAAAEAVDAIVNSLRELRERRLPVRKCDRVESFLAGFFKDVYPGLLRDVTQRYLGDDIDTFMNRLTPGESFARILMKSALLEIAAALRDLKSALVDKTVPLQALNLLAGNWIDHNALRPIEAIEREPGERRTFALNAEKSEIAVMYLQRAHGVPDDSLPTPLKLDPVWAEDRMGEMVEKLADQLSLKTGIDREVAKRLLTQAGAAPDPIYVLLPAGQEPDLRQMPGLRALFPDIVLFVLTGAGVPEGDATESSRSGARLLLPPIALGRADLAIRDYESATIRLKLAGGGR